MNSKRSSLLVLVVVLFVCNQVSGVPNMPNPPADMAMPGSSPPPPGEEAGQPPSGMPNPEDMQNEPTESSSWRNQPIGKQFIDFCRNYDVLHAYLFLTVNCHANFTLQLKQPLKSVNVQRNRRDISLKQNISLDFKITPQLSHNFDGSLMFGKTKWWNKWYFQGEFISNKYLSKYLRLQCEFP